MDIIKKDLGGNAEAEVVLYQPDSSIHIEVLVEGETVWLTQQQMSELFSTTRNNITLHIRNIFNEGELDEDSVCKESLRTAADGKKYRTKFYNLDVIISVGYRVKSIVGTKFRQWANIHLLGIGLTSAYEVSENDCIVYNLNMECKECPIVAYANAIDVAIADKFSCLKVS